MEPQFLQLQKEIQELQDKINHLDDIFFRQHSIDKDVFSNAVYFNGKIYFKDGTVLSLGGTTGMQFGNTGEKIGFLGHAPVLRQGAITTPSGGATQDAESRTAIGQIKTALTNLGLTA
jgi:hypothetical protein